MVNCSIEQIRAELARRTLMKFTTFTKPDYQCKWFHEYISNTIDEFLISDTFNKLMVWLPPQNGKSELSTRRFPAYALGKNPDTKIGVVAYNHTVASRFNRDVQRIISEPDYSLIFPETTLNQKNIRTISGSYLRNADEFEIVGRKGSLVSVGVGGGLTSRQIDLLIIDDVYKDAMEAWSPVVRENVWTWYNTVAETRLHKKSKQLIVFTRWHHDDLAGRLLKYEKKDWIIISIPALMDGNSVDVDTRKEGELLWPERHSLDSVLKIRNRDIVTFENLYQQNPKPSKGLMYPTLKTYTKTPEFEKICSYTDTADTGSDYLCTIVYGVYNKEAYVLDVLYTKDSMESTEPLTAEMLYNNNVNEAKIESNNGGRSFARNVERILKEKYKTNRTVIKWFNQSQNKQSRINTNSAWVMNNIYFPANWHDKWFTFYQDVTGYQKEGKNKNDDAPDVLTGVAEQFNRPKRRMAW